MVFQLKLSLGDSIMASESFGANLCQEIRGEKAKSKHSRLSCLNGLMSSANDWGGDENLDGNNEHLARL